MLIVLVGMSEFCRWMGIAIEDSKRDGRSHRKLTVIGVSVCIGFLGVFKYFNFFATSFMDLCDMIGVKCSNITIEIVLPLGISFFTFRGISYLVDISRSQLKAERSFARFSAYFAFFPQLFAGPIVRASEFMPQMEKMSDRYWKISVHDFISGASMFAWGAVMKVAMADTLAPVVDMKFAAWQFASSADVSIGVLFYAFQIYGDFAGYSLMSLGVARIMGFKFGDNFCRPYFSISFQEFWRKWHISLSTWLRDYLYIPLGGSRNGHIHRNLFLTMLIGGLWHGANWNFVLWGVGHGALLCLERPLLKLSCCSVPVKVIKCIGVFTCVMLLWIFFRAATLNQALGVLSKIAHIFTNPGSLTGMFQIARGLMIIALIIGGDVAVSFMQRRNIAISKSWVSGLYVGMCIVIILLFGSFQGNSFIYQQF